MDFPTFESREDVYEFVIASGPSIPDWVMDQVQKEEKYSEYGYAIAHYMLAAQHFGMDDWAPYTVRENIKSFIDDDGLDILTEILSVDPDTLEVL
ncbi:MULTISPECIES: hypothetical protein [Corynebacterium]|uniref:hypothetical protein n=1 Tax=Corynebacterium TaxID=1716 RepID=UPI00124D95F2|nr:MULTISPECIES: hypothetical protein [Corynebacterium]